MPLALSQGTFDGLISSERKSGQRQTLGSRRRHTPGDHQFIAEYIPLVSQAFWYKLSPDLQKMMTDLWAQNVPTYRANMAAAQTKARDTLEEHGVTFVDPSRRAERRRPQDR